MPTPEQWDEIYEILAEDCEIASYYINQEGKTCAIGALALKSGASVPDLLQLEAVGITTSSARLVREAIFLRFGLGAGEQNLLQLANDLRGKYAFDFPVWDYSAEQRRFVARAHVLATIAEMRARDTQWIA